MDYSKLSQEELISLLESQEEDQKNQILSVPDTDNLKTAYNISSTSIDTTSVRISNDDNDNDREVDNLDGLIGSLISEVESLYSTLKEEYFSKFYDALKYSSANNIPNKEWYPEAWILEGVNTIDPKEMLVKFLSFSSPLQREEIFNDYFKLDSDGNNKSARYQIGISVYQGTLLNSFDKILSSHIPDERKFEILSFISNFVKENNYPNANEYEKSIKEKILYNLNNTSSHSLFNINMLNDNKFNISTEDINLKNIISKINQRCDYITNSRELPLETRIVKVRESLLQVENILKSGLWDEQIKNVKDVDFQLNYFIEPKDKINTICTIHSFISHPEAKERFRSFIDGKSLELNSSDVFDNSFEKRKSPKP